MQNPLTLVLQDNVDTSIALKYIFLVVLTLNIDLNTFQCKHSNSRNALTQNCQLIIDLHS